MLTKKTVPLLNMGRSDCRKLVLRDRKTPDRHPNH